MDYNFNEIEKKWQAYWKAHKTYKAENKSDKPKYYVLDMFPYPSGAGLHVGHPLGYIASDIFSRYKRHKGYNVLHPMGYDAYGLPAEQYAIQTGQHPAITTEKNIARYREQLDKIGFSFDWDREVRTCDPSYYKWTQWTFIQLFNHYYNLKTNKAESISELVAIFEKEGNRNVNASTTQLEVFTAETWNSMTEKQQQEMLMHYRLTYLSDTMVNWCPQLGTVLANDEVVGGLSVRGGYPVERKSMRQWSLRISAYADRLLQGFENLDWSDSIKEIQKNWIGKSQGAEVSFLIASGDLKLEIFTTRPDTIFGVSFMVLCPEHEVISSITTAEQKAEVETYLQWAKNRSERERQAEVNKITGVFTGAFAINPLTHEEIPIWISDYVLSGYGTGAIMAVPAHDSRDFAFARHFNLPIPQVILPTGEQPEDTSLWKESKDSKEGSCINSGFITGMNVKDGIKAVIDFIEKEGIGKRMINFRLRDAIFSRQRYWGEPFPVYYNEGMPYMLDESKLPLELPAVDKYLPTESGEPPLARAKNWKTDEGFPLECNTMPGFAGSSAYYLRYMDPRNDKEIFSKEANTYWQNVDLYIGGAEHATGHLIYSRFWNKFLFDLGLCVKDEPFQKLINQGMIQGVSAKARIITIGGEDAFGNIKENRKTYILPSNFPVHLPFEISTHIHIEFLDWEKGLYKLTSQKLIEMKTEHSMYKEFEFADFHSIEIIWRKCFPQTEFDVNVLDTIMDEFVYIQPEVEKMSKTYYNVQNPDDLVVKYGADTLRMYEMFLGPLEQSKPWDTKGIEGVFRFIRKFWKLYHDENNVLCVTDEKATAAEFKVLHKTIKKITEDIERFSFNTAVSSFMICTNELNDLKCHKREILQPLAVLISPYAPHLAEELWERLGNKESISTALYPICNETYLVENTFNYPISFNGKTRFQLEFPSDMAIADIEKAVLEHPDAQKWLEGKSPKKVIIVLKKIVNIVI
jgi:leucyl-tRNA synthetase